MKSFENPKQQDSKEGLEWLSSASQPVQQEIAKQGKESLDLLHSAKSNSQAITSQDRGQAIIDSQRTTNTVESERIGLNLDDAAKIVKSFENPTDEGEDLFRPGDFTQKKRQD